MIKNYTLDKYTIKIFEPLCESNAIEKFSELTVAYGAISEEKKGPKPVGIIIGHPTPRDFVIDWIYVAKKYRRKKVASKLFERIVAAVAKVDEIEGILGVLTEEDENLYRFLQSEGAFITPAQGVGQFHANLSDLKLPKTGKGIVHAKSTDLEMIPKHYFRALEDSIEDNNKKSPEGVHIPRGVVFPINPQAYSEFSKAILQEEEIAAIILIEEEEDAYRISWLYSKPSFSKRLLGLLLETGEEIMEEDERPPKEIPIVFGTLNENSLQLGEKIFPNAEFEQLLISYMAVNEEK